MNFCRASGPCWFGDMSPTTAAILPVEPDFALQVLAQSKVGIWERDPVRGLIRCNPTMSAIYGLSSAQGRRGVPLDEFRQALVPEDLHRFEARDALAVAGGSLMFTEYRVRGRDGAVRWVLVRGVYEAIRPGWVIAGGRGIAIDITQSKAEGHAEGEPLYRALAPVPMAEPPSLPLDHAVDLALALHREAARLADMAPTLLPAMAIVLEILRAAAVADASDE